MVEPIVQNATASVRPTVALRPAAVLLGVAVAALAALPALAEDWNPRLAAEYLDGRQKEWFAWPPAKAPGGPCVSCHTGATYLLARPVLRRALGEREPTTYEVGLARALRARLEKKDPKELFPAFATEPRASQAIGVEAVFSALFLTLEQPRSLRLSPSAEQAFERLWSLQIREGKAKGAWSWFDFNLDPWETPDSGFYGAALAALAAGSAPAEYRERAEVKQRVAELVAYLAREQQAQPLHNRLILLWASAKLPSALDRPARQTIIEDARRKQQPDGSWTLDGLGPWKEHAGAPSSTGGSSYATAVAALALEKAGVPTSDPGLTRALDWLRSHQDRTSGSWMAESMNKRYEPGSMQLRFMQDAATAFSVLALLEADTASGPAHP